MRDIQSAKYKKSLLTGGLAVLSILPFVGIAGGSDQTKPSGRRSTDPPVAAKGKLGQDLFLAIDHRDIAATKQLLKSGADANARNGLEFTPLYIASASHQPEAMKALISAGANIHATSPYGTALTFAALSGNTEGVKILMDRGAKANVLRVDGGTVLMGAAQSGNPETVAELIKRGAKVNELSYSKTSALGFASRHGHTAAGRILIKAGAKVDQVDDYGQTPLMDAAKAGHADFVKLLIEAGANVNQRDKQGKTPLILAAGYGNSPEAVKALIAAGANAQAKDNAGMTALQAALQRGQNEVAEVLGGGIL